MLVAFSLAPSASGEDGSVSDAVAEVVALVRASGLPHRTDSMFTTIEGTWEECTGLVGRCIDVLTATAPRVSLVLKADVRPGRTGELTAKLDRLEDAIGRLDGGRGGTAAP